MGVFGRKILYLLRYFHFELEEETTLLSFS